VMRRDFLLAPSNHRSRRGIERPDAQVRPVLRVVPYERTSGWSSKTSEAEMKGVAVGD
jgi:hypothetical protein